MKTLGIFVTFVAMSLCFTLSAQNSKVLVKTLTLDNDYQIAFAMKGEVEVKTWAEDYARVLIHIEYHNANFNLLKTLIAKGRYNITTTNKDGILTLYCDDIEHPLIFGNDKNILDETISYTIYVPKYLEVKQTYTKELIVSE